MNKKDSLGDRMKNNYEKRSRTFLTRRMPIIIRLDGKAFHTLTKNLIKPFDSDFIFLMQKTALHLMKEIQGAKLAYVQSDEISILLTDYTKLTTDAWFDGNVQKITSVSAAIASGYFSYYFGKPIAFDSRVFNIPKEEVANYFVWRQQDWVRNSIQMLSQAHFSHKELHKKNQVDMHEMLYTKNINWANLPSYLKNGTFICYDKIVDEDVPVITQDRNFVERFVYIEGEEDEA